MSEMTKLTNVTMQEFMEQAFKFKIGELVAWNRNIVALRSEFELNGPRSSDRVFRERIGTPRAAQVIERWMQQCHGGVQLQYRLSGLETAEGGPILTTAVEPELASFEEGMAAVRLFMPKTDGEKGA